MSSGVSARRVWAPSASDTDRAATVERKMRIELAFGLLGRLFRARSLCRRLLRGAFPRRRCRGRPFHARGAAASETGALRFRAAEELRGRVDRNRFRLRLFDLVGLGGRDDLAGLQLDRLDFDDLDHLQRLHWNPGLLQRRSLEHAQPAAPVALDADEAFLLTRLEQIHQPAESVAPLVEAARRLPEDLLDVAQIHWPARVGRRREDRAGALHTLGRGADRLDVLNRN